MSNGIGARLADASDTTSNSALVALASNDGTFSLLDGAALNPNRGINFSNIGTFYLDDGATISPNAWNNFDNTGTWYIDVFGGEGGTTLTLGGTLTNSGRSEIGPDNFSLSAADTLTAAALDNTSTGSISLWGSSAAIAATLIVSGAATNSGNITLSSFSAADIAGPLTSTGSGIITIGANARLELGSAANGTVEFNGTDGLLKLDQPGSFTGTIAGFGLGDTIDLGDTTALGASQSAGTLTVDLSDGETLTYSLRGYFVGTEFEVTPNGSDSDITLVVGADIPPAIVVPRPMTAGVGQSLAISGVEVTDPVAVSVGETITVTLTDRRGALSADTDAVGGGGTITGSGSNTLTIIGSLNQVDADLTTLDYVAATAGTDTIDVNANDGRGGVAPERTIAVNVVTPAPAELEVIPTSINFGIVHIGDTIQQSLTITNDVAPPALGLDAEFSGTTTGVTATGSITDLPVDRTDASDLFVGIDTSESGTIDGSATLSASSYGGGPLPSQTIEVEGTVQAYAVPTLTLQSVGFINPLPGARLSQIGNQWTLDLGADPAGTAISPIDLIAENGAVGLADTLGGNWSYAPTTAFNIVGASSFVGVSDTPPTGPEGGSPGSAPPHGLFIEPLDTSPGVNTETIVLQPISENSSSSTVLQDQTITVIDTITASTYNTPIVTGAGTYLPPEPEIEFPVFPTGLPLESGILTQIGNAFTLSFPDLTDTTISPFFSTPITGDPRL